MDIQDLGFFDMIMACQGESVDLQLFCPQAVAPFSSIVNRHAALGGNLHDFLRQIPHAGGHYHRRARAKARREREELDAQAKAAAQPAAAPAPARKGGT